MLVAMNAQTVSCNKNVLYKSHCGIRVLQSIAETLWKAGMDYGIRSSDRPPLFSGVS